MIWTCPLPLAFSPSLGTCGCAGTAALRRMHACYFQSQIAQTCCEHASVGDTVDSRAHLQQRTARRSQLSLRKLIMPAQKRQRSSDSKSTQVQLDPAVFGESDGYGDSPGSLVQQHSSASESAALKSERVAEQSEQTSRTQKRLSKSQQRKLKKLAVC